jgi:glutamate N-acetyltransferase/amino-acid N-acetyltransferase
VCSTGLIGIPLPFTKVEAGVAPLVAARSPDGGADAARAILTTDTAAKEVVVAGDGFSVGGMAKGAAMLAPNMATMLAVLTTDAAASPDELANALRLGVTATFNALSVDGCTSTNDTVILLANGAAGPVPPMELVAGVRAACASLAEQMAADAEGMTKVARVRVDGARSDAEAWRAARKVAESQLVQCSLHGADPYWGRIVSELGTAGVDFHPDRVSVAYGDVVVCRDGVAAPHDDGAVRAHLESATVVIHADLGLGDGTAEVLTTDLSPAYIAENMKTS